MNMLAFFVYTVTFFIISMFMFVGLAINVANHQDLVRILIPVVMLNIGSVVYMFHQLIKHQKFFQ
ncbi:hypothetical protein [Alishewanella phage vB_AspM_Slicko01]|nr:hypothetical protein [Alishewanella phage vB_AspM_Slicko01]